MTNEQILKFLEQKMQRLEKNNPERDIKIISIFEK